MKKTRRLLLPALDFVLLFALFGCAAPGPAPVAYLFPGRGFEVAFAESRAESARAVSPAASAAKAREGAVAKPPEPASTAAAFARRSVSDPFLDGWLARYAPPPPAAGFVAAANLVYAGPTRPADEIELTAAYLAAKAHAEAAEGGSHAESAEAAEGGSHAESAEAAEGGSHAEFAEAAEGGSHAESAEAAEGGSHAEFAEAAEGGSHAEFAEAAEGGSHAEFAEAAEGGSHAESAEAAEKAVVGGGAGEAEPPPVEPSNADAAAEAALPPRPAAPAIPWKTETYSLVARSMDLRQALETFGVAQGVPVMPSPGVVGAISGEFVDVPCGEFLDRLATLHNLTWYWDGATLWVYAAGEMQTILLDLRYMKAGEVRGMLRELGVEDSRFPLKTANEDELIMVSGPPRYVALVAEMIQKADTLREKRTFTEIETRIFPLRNTWADDVAFNAGSPESGGSIRGVASMLQQIVGKIATPDSREAGSTNAPIAFQPLITAENRLNAVIVTDVATRMPLYERLIGELDVPQKLLEIEVTVVELSRRDALDWQLSIAGTGGKDRISAGAGQNAGNLFDSENLAGRGLAGALTYLGSRSTVSLSLTALRDKGKARSISRTTLLTVNNLAAELSDTQTYHTRVVGAEVAELAEVSAGTMLQIKPRIMRAGTNGTPARIWLTLSLQDGGFESIAVDSMPMTRSSSLDTQTSVYEEETIVLAGYLRDIEESGGWGIPLLRDLPLIGWLFGGHSSKTETVQRLFLISPRVVDADAEDLARLQAMKLRDISVGEELQDDARDMDEVRELRDLDRLERRERREDALGERVKERRAELRRARDERARLRRERETMDETQSRGGCLPW